MRIKDTCTNLNTGCHHWIAVEVAVAQDRNFPRSHVLRGPQQMNIEEGASYTMVRLMYHFFGTNGHFHESATYTQVQFIVQKIQ